MTFQWTVQVDPKFHEGASNLKELVPFEECLELHSTDEGVVRVPDYLLLTHNGRSFKLVFSNPISCCLCSICSSVPCYLCSKVILSLCSIVVDPTNLGDGVHYFEVYGIDCKAPDRGPLFRIPVTIIIPETVANRPPVISFQQMSFISGYPLWTL